MIRILFKIHCGKILKIAEMEGVPLAGQTVSLDGECYKVVKNSSMENETATFCDELRFLDGASYEVVIYVARNNNHQAERRMIYE